MHDLKVRGNHPFFQSPVLCKFLISSPQVAMSYQNSSNLISQHPEMFFPNFKDEEIETQEI